MDKTIESELLSLERQFWQAMKDKDAKTASRLTDYPCLIAGAQGVSRVDEEAMTSMLKAPSWTLHDFALDEHVEVRALSEDVAVLAYKVHEDLTVDGKPVALDAADASVWIRKDGRWLCAAHTESLAGDPFGRDRRSA